MSDHLLRKEREKTEQVDIVTDDLVDDFCYEVALTLRRILNLEEEESDYDETNTEN